MRAEACGGGAHPVAGGRDLGRRHAERGQESPGPEAGARRPPRRGFAGRGVDAGDPAARRHRIADDGHVTIDPQRRSARLRAAKAFVVIARASGSGPPPGCALPGATSPTAIAGTSACTSWLATVGTTFAPEPLLGPAHVRAKVLHGRAPRARGTPTWRNRVVAADPIRHQRRKGRGAFAVRVEEFIA